MWTPDEAEAKAKEILDKCEVKCAQPTIDAAMTASLMLGYTRAQALYAYARAEREAATRRFRREAAGLPPVPEADVRIVGAGE